MARTDPTPSVHLYRERDDTPGVCRRCNCIKANAAHVEPGDPRLADAAEQQAQHHQRYERDPDTDQTPAADSRTTDRSHT